MASPSKSQDHAVAGGDEVSVNWTVSGRGPEFGLRVGRVEFAEGGGPVGVEVGGTGIAAGVGEKTGKWQVDEGHGGSWDRGGPIFNG